MRANERASKAPQHRRERSLLEVDQVDLEDGRCIRWNVVASALLSERQLGWDDKSTLSANPHADETLVPSLNDLASSKSKREGLPTTKPLFSGVPAA